VQWPKTVLGTEALQETEVVQIVEATLMTEMCSDARGGLEARDCLNGKSYLKDIIVER
jgi:hypothetical protein